MSANLFALMHTPFVSGSLALAGCRVDCLEPRPLERLGHRWPPIRQLGVFPKGSNSGNKIMNTGKADGWGELWGRHPCLPGGRAGKLIGHPLGYKNVTPYQLPIRRKGGAGNCGVGILSMRVPH
jgi:hypothetical protein